MPKSSTIDIPHIVGNWSFLAVPDGWERVPETGIRCPGAAPWSNVAVAEELLPSGMTFERYLESQLVLSRRFLPEPVIDGPGSKVLAKAGPAQEIGIRYVSSTGEAVIQVQFYLHRGDVVGIVTFTTTEKQSRQIRNEFNVIRDNLVFREQ